MWVCVVLTPARPVPVLLRPRSETSKQPQAGQPQNPALGLPKATKRQREAIKSPVFLIRQAATKKALMTAVRAAEPGGDAQPGWDRLRHCTPGSTALKHRTELSQSPCSSLPCCGVNGGSGHAPSPPSPFPRGARARVGGDVACGPPLRLGFVWTLSIPNRTSFFSCTTDYKIASVGHRGKGRSAPRRCCRRGFMGRREVVGLR